MPIYINPDISREQQRICNCNNIYVQNKAHSLTLIIVLLNVEYKSLFEKKAFYFHDGDHILNTCYNLP